MLEATASTGESFSPSVGVDVRATVSSFVEDIFLETTKTFSEGCSTRFAYWLFLLPHVRYNQLDVKLVFIYFYDSRTCVLLCLLPLGACRAWTLFLPSCRACWSSPGPDYHSKTSLSFSGPYCVCHKVLLRRLSTKATRISLKSTLNLPQPQFWDWDGGNSFYTHIRRNLVTRFN